MRYSFIIICIAYIIGLISSSCANQLQLTGGPKDEVAPQFDTLVSTKNYQTFFKKQDIELSFDEFIDLKDANKQIVISPPLEFPLQIKNRLKKISIELNEKETLKENATYVVNFGKSIKDYTEGNILENFTFVFSTGAYIDSLTISGTVIDAKTQEPKEDILVLLYTNHQDSVIYKERPFYFAVSGEGGAFEIKNLRADTFKVLALGDQNVNYTFDPLSEEIGFLEDLYILNDTTTQEIQIEVFKEISKARYKSYTVEAQGKLKVEFEGIPDSSSVTLVSDVPHLIDHKDDNPFITIWYTPRNTRSLQFEIFKGNEKDTISARINPRTIDTLKGGVELVNLNINSEVGLHPNDVLSFDFNRPVKEVDMTQIIFIDTLSKDTLDVRFVNDTFPCIAGSVTHAWATESDIEMIFLPGAFKDIFDGRNDTITRILKIGLPDDFGDITLDPINFDSVNYVITLLKDGKKKGVASIFGNSGPITFDRLAPGSYSLEIIEDIVPNGRWDPGNYLQKRQSERIYEVPLDVLKPGWKMEEILDLSTIRAQLNAVSTSENEE